MLEDREHHTKDQNLPHLWFEQIGKTHVVNFLLRQRGFDLRHSRVRVTFAANLRKHGVGRFSPAILRQPARAFRHEKHTEEKQNRRNCSQAEHPAPALLTKP